VREPYRPQVETTSEGVQESGAAPWISAGKDGTGVKVAIVDVGFIGYSSKLGTELPASVETDFSRCTGDGADVHGTAVAEVIHDEAPGAAIRLVCVEDDIGFASALGTLQAAGVKVVNGSIGFTLSGRGDGSGAPGSVSDAVAKLRRQDILYVAAAGNYGDTHWAFNASGDTGANHAQDQVGVTIDDNDSFEFLIAPGETAVISITWDAWPSSTLDFDAYVGNNDCGLLVGSEFDQAAGAGVPPVEVLTVPESLCPDSVFELVINRFSNGSAAPRMDLFFDGPVLTERANGSSLPEPASSPAVFTVGADCPVNHTVEPYSSVGPTIDGRTKPDIVGPDAGSSSVYGNASGTCAGGFRGTSAAAPHVAGAAADLLSANGALDTAELQQLLQDRAIDAGPTGKDVLYGSGGLSLGPAGSAPAPTPRRLTPMTPLRLFDSRPGPLGASEAAFGAQGRTTPIGGNSEVAVQVAGIAGVPADATAVVLNVTAVAPTAEGWITVHPDGIVPLASNLNFQPGQTVAVHVTATVGPDDKVRLYNSAGNTNLIVDIAGWYGPTGSGNAGFTALAAPSRAFDSRPEEQGYAEGVFGPNGRTTPIGPNSEVQFPLTGLAGIPANATAVVVNLTVAGPTAPGWLTLYPTGSSRPLASTLNFVPGTVAANLAVIPVGTNTSITIYNSDGSSHALVDVVGYFTQGSGAGYVALDPPTRDLDSRTGNGPRFGALTPGAVHRLEVARYYGVPKRAAAVLLNVTAVTPTKSGWFTVYPGTASLPLASNLNFSPGAAVPNAVVSGLGTDGTIAIYNASIGGNTQVLSDLAGYFVLP
jgi:subtilisin family serine protease